MREPRIIEGGSRITPTTACSAEPVSRTSLLIS